MRRTEEIKHFTAVVYTDQPPASRDRAQEEHPATDQEYVSETEQNHTRWPFSPPWP